MDATSTRDGRIAAVASLDQPVRRLLYDLLAARDAWTSRDEAASALDVPRSVAAFHLDKLADAGVVAVTFERTSGRAGPGAGRPAKLYRLVADEVSASMPDRHYDLAGQLLAAAVVESTASGVPVDESLHRIAREAGRTMAHEGGGGDDEPGQDLLAALERWGYEPTQGDDGQISLANCPFHRLAEEHRSLVCGMNLDVISGLLEGLEAGSTVRAHLDPQAGSCCVRLRPA